MRIKRLLNRIMPLYGWILVAGCVLLNVLVYYGSRLITTSGYHYDLAIPLDAQVPYWPPAIIIYVLAYVSWGLNYVLIARDSRELCGRVLVGEYIGKLICLVFFLLLPSSLQRPEAGGSGLIGGLMRAIYATDIPDNLFPSIHCMESWICFRGLAATRRAGRLHKLENLLFTLMVCASTVLVKQHVLVDIIGGIAAAEAGLFIARRLHAERVPEWLEGRLARLKRR